MIHYVHVCHVMLIDNKFAIVLLDRSLHRGHLWQGRGPLQPWHRGRRGLRGERAVRQTEEGALRSAPLQRTQNPGTSVTLVSGSTINLMQPRNGTDIVYSIGFISRVRRVRVHVPLRKVIISVQGCPKKRWLGCVNSPQAQWLVHTT